MSEAEPRQPHHVDVYVGARIRMRRKVMGLSQDALARAVGLTFQQVQKYERGSNRVSASKLFQIAKALETSVAYFFEGLEATPGPSRREEQEAKIAGVLRSEEGLELITCFANIAETQVRRRVLDLVRTLSGAEAV